MSILLYCVGAIGVAVGLIMAGFGIPVKEFSFGNTLILSGTIATVGGLIIVGLGVVVSRLQQILDAGVTQPALQPPAPLESFPGAPPVRQAASRAPFPSRRKTEPREAASPTITPIEPMQPAEDVAPSLPNPDEGALAIAEAVPLSPPQAITEPANLGETFDEPEPESPKTAFEKEWPAPAAERRGTFGFKWPERKSDKPAKAEEEPPVPPAAEAIAPAEELPLPAAEPRNVAVLKSGVVDGMGYTLYVDGSIEAELPQGTLRFASINELRQHLEQNG